MRIQSLSSRYLLAAAAWAGVLVVAPLSRADEPGVLPELDSVASPPWTLVGTVIASKSRETSDGRRIVTDSVVESGGKRYTVTQPGGEVGAVGERVMGLAPVLGLGDHVSLLVQEGKGLNGTKYLSVLELYERLPTAGVEDPEHPWLRFSPSISAKTERQLYWRSSCIFVTYDSTGTPDLAGNTEFDILDQVFDNWEKSTEQCSYLRFVHQEKRVAAVDRADRVNVVKFQTKQWCIPAASDAPAVCNVNQPALTHVSYILPPSSREGEIVDVDIEINAVNYAISAHGESLGTQGCASDLANVMAHEVGHMIGLSHGCLMPEDNVANRDGNGEPLLSCFDPALPSAIRSSTMYGTTTCGETQKAKLSDDDIAGVCALMPLAHAPAECSPVSGSSKVTKSCSCTAVGTDPTGAWSSAWLLALGAVWRRFSRKRSDASQPH